MAMKNEIRDYNATLSRALKKHIKDYGVGAFRGIRAFEYAEMLRSLDTFQEIMLPNTMEYINNVVAEAFAVVCADEVVSRVRSMYPKCDEVLKYANREHVLPTVLKHFLIGPIAIIDKDGKVQTPNVLAIRGSALHGGGQLVLGQIGGEPFDPNALPAEVKNEFDRTVLICATTTPEIISGMTQAVIDNATIDVSLTMGYGIGPFHLSSDISPNTSALNSLVRLLNTAQAKRDSDEEFIPMDVIKTMVITTEDDLREFADLMSPSIATVLISVAAQYGIVADVAQDAINDLNYKIIYTKPEKATGMITLSLSYGSELMFAKSIRANDLMRAVTTDDVTSAAKTRVGRFLMEAGVAYTTGVMLKAAAGN